MRNYETKLYQYTDKNTGQKVVKATTMYAGKSVSAIAKCDPQDTFDPNFGAALALKRLDLKIAQKRHASMIAYAKFCMKNLDFIHVEKRRAQKALARAEVAALDRKLDIKKIETELAEMLKNI